MDSSNWRTRASGSDGTATDGRQRPSYSRQPDQRYAERSRPEDLRVHRPAPQRDDEPALSAIEQGRRVYLGNLVYQARPESIEEFLAAHQFGQPEKIHISIDPISGRNPGYCFIEFASPEAAESAIATLDGQTLLGREVKCRPCLPKGRENGPRATGTESGSNRWGDWNSRQKDRENLNSGRRTGPNDALRYFESSASDGKQLYVGGLPRMMDQAMHEEEMRAIFQDYEVEVVGKRISPKQPSPDSDRRNFCFVDFSTAEQAKAALEALDGTIYRESPLKISMSKGRRPGWTG